MSEQHSVRVTIAEFPKATVYDPPGQVAYIPFVSEDGRVGYRVVDTSTTDGKETFIYFNPSVSEGPGDANVFIYEGIENDPAEDNPLVFVVPEALLPEEAG